jgi:hypothetical protein
MLQNQMIEAQKAQQDAQLAYDAEQAQLDRDSNEEIARIRALGGLQSDNNADGQLDAAQNLEGTLRAQELGDQRQMADDKINQKRQSDFDKNMVQREKNMVELKKAKIAADAALAVAKENKTAAEMKKKAAAKKAKKK